MIKGQMVSWLRGGRAGVMQSFQVQCGQPTPNSKTTPRKSKADIHIHLHLKLKNNNKKKEIRVTYMGRLLTKFSWTDKKQLVIMIVYMCSCSKISALLLLSFSVTRFFIFYLLLLLCIFLCHFLLLLREAR
jgi:hypothetical protein